VHTIVRIETEGMSPQEAIAAPRLHPARSAWRFEQPARLTPAPGTAGEGALAADCPRPIVMGVDLGGTDIDWTSIGPTGPSHNTGTALKDFARPIRLGALALLLPASLLVGPGAVAAQRPPDLDAASDRQLYDGACANCHGVDGTGLERSLVGFEEPLPDFSDCDFAAREPDADWIAVAHEGGPVRGFSEMMPAFRGALTPEQLARVMRYVRTLCADPNWPRGELNLPRALLTEKAFPEDEWVIEADAGVENDRAVTGQFVYEQRFGPRSQFEVVIPYGWREIPDGSGGTRWADGLGDLVLGVKHAAYHSAEAGRIFALGGEVILPTGDDANGFGNPGTTLEGFASFGQILPADAFLQLQTGIEAPLYRGADDEVFGRAVVGMTFTQGTWGRAWSPMLEVQGKRDLESGAQTAWDLAPQMQVSLNTRQHVLANVGVVLPLSQTQRPVRLLMYVLLDWFDGGFFEGW
jgi:mono/diheme cytochrome c family protein